MATSGQLLSEEEFHTLTPGFKKLQHFHRKYFGRYEQAPLNQVNEVLKASESELPNFIPGVEDRVIVRAARYAEMEPGRFYLLWKAQLDRLNLINFLLDALQRNGKLKLVEMHSSRMSSQKLLGKAVVAQVIANSYGRGYVMSSRPSKGSSYSVQVLLLDYGDVIEEEWNRLYELPEELSDIAPLCFRATLIPPDSPIKFDQICRGLFRSVVKANNKDEGIMCRIVAVHSERGNSIVQVDLLVPLGPLKAEQGLAGYLRDIQKDRDEKQLGRRGGISESELITLLQTKYRDFDIDVKEYSDLNINTLKKFQVIHAVSPNEIYLHNVSEVRVPAWYFAMQSFYKNKRDCEDFRITTSCLFENRCYIWLDNATKLWERVRLLEYPIRGRSAWLAGLWLLDRGRVVEGRKMDMMELDRQFAYPALALRAELVHIKPAGSLSWTPGQLSQFKELSQGKDFIGAIIRTSKTNQANLKSCGVSTSYGVILAGENEEAFAGTFQAMLVEQGIAYPDGPSCGRPDLANCLAYSPSYSREELMKEIDVTATTERKKMKEVSESLTLQIVSPNKNLSLAGVHCSAISNAQETCDSDYIPTNMGFRMAAIRISSVTGPGIFYVQMRQKERELEEMMNDLADIVKHLPYDGRLVKAGNIVLGQVNPKLGQPFASWAWARVVIVKVHEDTAKVIALDFGSQHLIRKDSVRGLPQYLTTIPSFCHRVHLDFMDACNQLTVPDITWPGNADTVWRRYVAGWQFRKPQYYAWQPGGAMIQGNSHEDLGIIKLEEFNQVLNFDGTNVTWYASRPRKSPDYACINKKKDHLLLKQFYTSIGINLCYCDRVNEREDVKFCPAWDVLVEKEFVEYLDS